MSQIRKKCFAYINKHADEIKYEDIREKDMMPIMAADILIQMQRYEKKKKEKGSKKEKRDKKKEKKSKEKKGKEQREKKGTKTEKKETQNGKKETQATPPTTPPASPGIYWNRKLLNGTNKTFSNIFHIMKDNCFISHLKLQDGIEFEGLQLLSVQKPARSLS